MIGPDQDRNDAQRTRGRDCAPGDFTEILRLALAWVAYSGHKFRSRLIEKARDPVLAPPLEIGIDKHCIIYWCHQFELDELPYRVAFSITLIAAIGIYALSFVNFDFVVLFFIIIIAAAVIGGMKSVALLSRLKQFKREIFNQSRFEPPTSFWPGADEFVCVGPLTQNVQVYRNFLPFEFAGVPSGGWSIAIDVQKRLLPNEEHLNSVSLRDLENELISIMAGQFQAELQYRELLIINGFDADILPRRVVKSKSPLVSKYLDSQLLPGPDVQLSSEQIEDTVSLHPNVAQRHMWFVWNAWGGELTLSYFLRLNLRGRILFIENNRNLLPPIDQHIREAIDERLTRSSIRAFIFGIFSSPIELLFQPMVLLFSFFDPHLKSRIISYRKRIKRTPRFNYGADLSLRRMLVGEEFGHYYQRTDVDRVKKSLDKVVLEVLADYLERHGIDVTDLRNKEMTIVNSGILVQGGDVNAQTLAVGQSAVAQTTGIPPGEKAGSLQPRRGQT